MRRLLLVLSLVGAVACEGDQLSKEAEGPVPPEVPVVETPDQPTDRLAPVDPLAPVTAVVFPVPEALPPMIPTEPVDPMLPVDGYQCRWPGNAMVTFTTNCSEGGPTLLAHDGVLDMTYMTYDGGQVSNLDLVRFDGSRNVVFHRLRLSEGLIAHRPRMIWTGSEYRFAYSDVRNNNNEIYVLGAGNDGLPQPEQRWTQNTGLSFPGTLAFSPERQELALVWSDGDGQTRQLQFALLGLDGSRHSPDLAIGEPGGVAEYADVVWTGARWFVAWYEWRDGNFGAYFTSVEPDGTHGTPILLGTPSNLVQNVRLAWNGQNAAVVWQGEGSAAPVIQLAIIDRNGQVSAGPRAISGGQGRSPSIVWAGDHYAVAFVRDRGGLDQIYRVRVSANAQQVGAAEQIVCSGIAAAEPFLAFQGRTLYLSWTHLTTPRSEVLWQSL